MTENAAYINCLVLLQTLEMYWAYYSLSDGKIYVNASRKSARAFAASLRQLAAEDPRILDEQVLNLMEDITPEDIVQRLETWEDLATVTPFDNVFHSIRKLAPFFNALKTYIIKKIGLDTLPHMQVNREELLFREGVTRWQAHLPTMVVMGRESPEELLARASAASSITVAAKIVRIEDLMIHAKSQESYLSFVHEFLQQTRMLVDEYMGVFDKFTGDGFIAHFSEAISDITNLDVVDCFVNFIRDEIAFADDLFGQWVKSIRKCPAEPVGLSLGADCGVVKYEDLASQLVVVGDPVIWSWRLAEMAAPGQVLINNLLYGIMENRADIQAEIQTVTTASGEHLLTRSIRFQ